MNELVQNKKKWELLFEAISQLDYGMVIPHENISKILHESYGSQKYNSYVQRAKKELLKIGKDIESVRGQGYRVLEPDQYIDKAVQAHKQGFDKLKKGNDIIQFAPQKDMSAEGRQVYRDVSDRARILYASMAGACTELKMLAKKKSPLEIANVSRK